ncbi:FRIGIDA-like protein 4a [Carica papaya]|uniref:FRIGIDA-like protein 4a n=1 Tax=Carica papaya TaxID=3649 RepID=UPI000B8C75BF|nr:FRIGIDA-like protein 4a [Carica papaya]
MARKLRPYTLLLSLEESNAAELNSIRAIIKCVEDHRLEPEFSLDSLRKRASQLETAKAEKKKSSASTTKPQNKRSHGAVVGRSGGPLFRPAKAAKFSNAYPSFARRNAGPPMQHGPAGRYAAPYTYPGQSVYEGASTYASTYGGTPSQSPAAISQQHYSVPVENVSTTAPGYRVGGSYGGQASYGSYDYGSAAPATYQPPPYGQ